MIDKWLSKTKFKEGYEKFVKKIITSRISANQLTVIGLVIGLISALFIYLSSVFEDLLIEFIVLSIIFTIVSFFVDTLDGSVARFEGPTIFGGILDIFCDRTVEISIIIAIISTDPLTLTWPGIFSLGAIVLCITMFLLIGGAFNPEILEDQKKVIYYRRGIMERSETLIFLLAITVIFFLRFILLWTFAILVFITALLRLKDAYNLFKK